MARPSRPLGRPKQSSEVPLAGSRRLDRTSDVPLYFQLAAALKAMLEVGAWESGARFASEREIEEEFEVSRAVIRPALELLVGDGAIVRVRGSGAYVAPPRPEVRVTGLIKQFAEPDEDREIVVLSARKSQPDRTVSHLLEIEGRRAKIAHVTALLDPGKPSVCLLDSYAPVAFVPWLLPAAEALKAGREPPGIDTGLLALTRADVAVEHTFFGEWGAAQTGAAVGDPAFMGRIVQFGQAKGSKRERPVEMARLIYRAENAQLAFEVE
jgi:DNA-binding GntR family transcriptional regulator